MKSTSQHLFSQAPQARIPRSKFVTPFNYKTTMDSGKLIPFYVDEALPGDTFNARFTAFARMSTPVCPVMDNMFMDFQFFAVPIRLVWDNFVRMMGERRDPEDSIDYLAPVLGDESGMALEAFSVGSMMDYMGMPTGVSNLSPSALWCRAYNLIWNEFYRDENLQERATVKYDDGPDDPDIYPLRRRGKRHDYFTSCLPWPQKGPGVQIPIGDIAPIFGYDGSPIRLQSPNGPVGSNLYANSSKMLGIATNGTLSSNTPIGLLDKGSALATGVNSGIYADLSGATMTTINSLRQAFQLQRLLEKDARSGTRYCELLEGHFGVHSPDSRLQRPEYLGGGSIPIQIHSVAQTSATDTTSPQGNLAAFGVTAGNVGFQKSFVEHTLLLGFVSVRADLSYQQGLPRMFSRRSRYDWYWPVLSNLGEQAVLNKEIFAQGTAADDEVFGYQERWAEYRFGVSKITGKLRSSDPQSLDVWHLAQNFSSLPKLNASFIEDNPPIKRALAVQTEPEFIFDCNCQCEKIRPMPLYSIPGMIDHF